MKPKSGRWLLKVMDLAAELGVDGFFLQALHDQNMSCHLPIRRNGHCFDYTTECLARPQLVEISERLRSRAKLLGLQYQADHLDFNMASVSDVNVPLCLDPWKTVYITSRGILPCCFARSSIAHWDQRGNRSLEQFVRDSINAPLMQEIRRALAVRQLSAYCLSCTSCPIVKTHQYEGALSMA